jgi:hypothetical protein
MDIEQEAKALGWLPKEQFRGDLAKWTDAETFVSRGKEIMPILRKNNERLVGEIGAVKQELTAVQTALAEATEALAEFKKYNEETSKRAYEKAVRDLRAQKADAIKEGDGEKVVEIEAALDDLDAQRRSPSPSPLPAPKPAAATAAPAPTAVHPDFAAWEADNKVWLAEPEKQAYAQSISSFVRLQNPTLQGRAFLDKITEMVEQHFGGAPAAKSESGGQGAGRNSKSRTYSDLPAEAKAACDRMEARLVGPNRAFKTQAEWRASYVSNYDWS